MSSKATLPGTRSHGFQRIVIVVGLVVGLLGLVMTILGIGGVGFTRFSFSNTIDVQTASGGVVAMLVGFGMATFLYYSMIRVDLALAMRATPVVMYARSASASFPDVPPLPPGVPVYAPLVGKYLPLPEWIAALSEEDLSILLREGKPQPAPSPTQEGEEPPQSVSRTPDSGQSEATQPGN